MTCRQRLLGATTVLMIIAAAGLAEAQPPARGPGGPGGRGGFGMFGRGPGGGDQSLWLLTRPEVQEELELVDDQKNKLKAVGDDLRQRMQKEFAGLRDIPQEERRAKFEELQKKGQTWAEEARKQVEEILLPHQLDRLHEISVQIRGPAALNDPQVQEQLGLNEQQKTRLRELREKTETDTRGMFEGLRDLPAEQRRAKMTENREKMQQMFKDAQDQTLAVLTEQQRSQFEEMKGAKIEFQLPQRGPGGPEGRRGPERRRRGPEGGRRGPEGNP